MKFLGFDNVLCISPHPDDIEYSMFGTIDKYKDTKFTILLLVQGGDCDDTTSEARLDEVINLWDKSGCLNVGIMSTPHKYMKELTEDKWINHIETEYLNRKKYDCILLPNGHDSHFEHRFVNGFGNALIRTSKISTIEYYTASTQDTWDPNFYVDVSDSINRKKQVLKHFESQQDRYYFKEEIIESFHSDFQCAKKGMNFVEKFKITNYYN